MTHIEILAAAKERIVAIDAEVAKLQTERGRLARTMAAEEAGAHVAEPVEVLLKRLGADGVRRDELQRALPVEIVPHYVPARRSFCGRCGREGCTGEHVIYGHGLVNDDIVCGPGPRLPSIVFRG